MNVEDIFLLIAAMPFFICGIALIILSYKLEKKQKDPNKQKVKKPNLYEAKVIDVQTVEKRNESGYLVNRHYSITIEYEKNGELKIQTFDSFNEYPTNSIIEAYIYSSGIVSVVTLPPIGYQFTNTKHTYVHGYTIARIAGFVLSVIPILSVCAQFSVLQWIPFLAILGVFVGIPGTIGIKLYKKGKKKIADIGKGIYEQYNATVVDIKRDYHKNSSGNGGSYIYYPIVQFEYKGELCRTAMKTIRNLDLDAIGTSVPVYIHKETDELLETIDTTALLAPAYIAFGFAGFFILIFLFGLL